MAGDSVQMTVRLKGRQGAFWERKKKEMKRMAVLDGKEAAVSNSLVFQGLVELWMALDAPDKARKKPPSMKKA